MTKCNVSNVKSVFHSFWGWDRCLIRRTSDFLSKYLPVKIEQVVCCRYIRRLSGNPRRVVLRRLAARRDVDFMRRAASTSGTPCRTWSPRGPTPPPCSRTSECECGAPAPVPSPEPAPRPRVCTASQPHCLPEPAPRAGVPDLQPVGVFGWGRV